MTTPDDDFFRNPAVRPEPRQLIRRDLRDLGVTFSRRPIFPGNPESATTETPEPLPGIRAALKLRYAADRDIADCARYAREDGQTWDEIGDALGCKPDRGDWGESTGEAAFRQLASDLGRGPSFAWTCSCGQTIIDTGPANGHPEDREQGHGEGCTRLAAEIAAWRARWEGEQR